MTAERPLCVRVAADTDVARLIVESVHVALPGCDVSVLDPQALAQREIPGANCTIVGPTFAGRSGTDVVRALRAAGLEGPVVRVHANAPSPDVEGAALGAVDGVAADMSPDALARAIAAATCLDEDSPEVRALRRAQRLLAMGEIASGLQHALNNPLTALLAEAQLLEMESLSEGQREAVQRMVELCRRVAAVVRRLDVVGKAPGM